MFLPRIPMRALISTFVSRKIFRSCGGLMLIFTEKVINTDLQAQTEMNVGAEIKWTWSRSVLRCISKEIYIDVYAKI